MGFNSGKIKVESSAKKKTNAFSKDVKEDLAGQWKNPGQITKVPSGNITMNGVPYPVYGMDNLGNGQMMYPNMDYQFPGNMVTEYPMLQDGGEPMEYEEMELSDEELEEYRKGGYVVEELPQAQIGYNTPEYNKAYDEGTITRYNPETDVYQAPNLKEFTITENDPRVLNAIRDSRGNFINTTVESLSQPQKQMVEWMTGRQQFPSEALNIENPIGAFTLDAVTDPLNLIGAGAANRAFNLSKRLKTLKVGTNSIKNRVNDVISQPTIDDFLSGSDDVAKAGMDDFLTRPLTGFTKNELTPGKHLYRKIGNKKGLQDLIDKGGAQAPRPFKMKSGETIDTPFFGIGDKPLESYKGMFAVETPLPSQSKYGWTSRAGGVNNYGLAPFFNKEGLVKNIPLEDLNVYRKKWFSNKYKKLDPNNLEEGLKYANTQNYAEKAFKWGTRGAIAHDIYQDDEDDITTKIINTYNKNVNKQPDDAFEELELTDEEVEEYRNGGYIVEMQDGGGIKRNTKEYKEAYNKGTVTRYNPETDTYQAPNLPEFEVKPRGFMDEMDQIGHTAMNFLGEITPFNSITRIVDDPVGTAKGTGQTLADLAMHSNPVAALYAGANDINPITGQPYWQGVDQALDVAGVIPELGAGAKALRLGKHAKNFGKKLAYLGNDIKHSFLNQVAHPIKYSKTIKELKAANAGLQDLYRSPEMARRLETIGLKADDLTIPELYFQSGRGSSYTGNELWNFINMDLNQIKNLKKQRYNLTPRQVYEHEVGHWLQKQGAKNSPKYKRQLQKYNSEKNNFDFPPPLRPFTSQRTIYDELLTRKPLTDLPGALPDQILPYEAISGANPQLSRAYDSWDYFNYRGADETVEPLAHAREMRQTMIEQGYLKNLEDKITDEKLMEFIEKNPTDRISSFIAKRPDTVRRLKQIINNAPAVVPGAVGAGVLLNQERDGGEIMELTDAEVAELKRQGYKIENV